MDPKLFSAPDIEFRPLPIWSWNDKLNKHELFRQIDEMKKQGLGGFFIRSGLGLVTGYFTDKWFSLIKDCIIYGKKAGLKVWLCDDEFKHSGSAGGLVPSLKEAYREKGLLLTDDKTKLESDRYIKTVRVNGIAYYLVERISAAGNARLGHACFIDIFNIDAVKAFLDSTHKKYKDALGDTFKSLEGFYTEKPCCLNADFGCPSLPYSTCLRDFIMSEKGYDIEEFAECLFFDIKDYKKIRFDFYDCVSRLFTENYTVLYSSWCDSNFMKMAGNFYNEDGKFNQLIFNSSIITHYFYQHLPAIGNITAKQSQAAAVKQLASVSEQMNKKALGQCFDGIKSSSDMSERKRIVDWQTVQGISILSPCQYQYSLRGERKRDTSPLLFCQQPFWREEKLFNDYASRLSYFSSLGKRRTKTLVISPIDSIWCSYSPIKKDTAEYYHDAYNTLMMKLSESGINYHTINETLLHRLSEITPDGIKIGDYLYSNIILPPSLTLRAATVILFKECGKLNVFTIEKEPEMIEGKNINPNLHIHSHYTSIETAISGLKSEGLCEYEILDIVTGKPAKDISISIKDCVNYYTVLAVNSSDSRELEALIRVRGEGAVVMACLSDGKIKSMPYEAKGGFTYVKARFYAAGSLAFMVYKDKNAVPVSPNVLSDTLYSPDGCIVYGKNKLMPVMSAQPDTCTRLDLNALSIYYTDLWQNGNVVACDAHLSTIWHKHFYNIADGTHFTAEFKFFINKFPKGDVFAVIENAENLDSVLINGKRAKVMREKGSKQVLDDNAFIDASFTKADITYGIKKGLNVIRIDGYKYNNITDFNIHRKIENFKDYYPTELETVYIIGNFVSGSDGDNPYISGIDDNKLPVGDASSCGLGYYAGRILYSSNIQLPYKNGLYLFLPDFKGITAKCVIDGVLVGVCGWKPYCFDLSIYKGKRVKLEIEIAGDLYNMVDTDKFFDSSKISDNTADDNSRLTRTEIKKPFGLSTLLFKAFEE